MKTLCYFLLSTLVLYAPVSLADVYKGKDSSGNTIFSDKPFSGAQKMEVPQGTTYTSPPVTSQLEHTKKTEPVAYQLSIISPSQDQTFTTDIKTITVSVSITPPLQAGDKIQLLLNGQPYGTPNDATAFTLESLFRGAYKVQAQVINEAHPNVPVAQSNEVTFYQRRTSVR